MIRLRLLGGLTLQHDGVIVTGPAKRRRSLALLALLASAEERGISREQLLVYLWPESNTQRARRSLNQALYSIRQHLGEEVVVGTTTLRLNPERVTCDLWEYRAALKRCDLPAAMRLREGEVLETFTLPGIPEFEQWLEGERSRDARTFRDALERIARSAAREGDHRASMAYWKWLAVEEPLSARVAQECVMALAAGGDLPGALAHAEGYAARVRSELWAEPAAEVLVLAAGIRNRLAALEPGASGATLGAAAGRTSQASAAQVALVGGAPPATGEALQGMVATVTAGRGYGPDAAPAFPGAGPAAADVPEFAEPEHAQGPYRVESSADAPGGDRAVRTRARPPLLMLATLVLLAAVVLWGGVRSRPRPPGGATAGAGETQSVVVFPFAVHGVPEAQYLSAALASLLVSGLDGAGGLRATLVPAGWPAGTQPARADRRGPGPVVEEAARRGADFFITGEVIISGENLRVRASLHRRGVAQPLGTTTRQGTSSKLFEISDDIVLNLLQRWEGMGRGRVLRPRVVTTPSLAALRSYLAGDAALRADRYSEAVEEYRKAIREDSTFALAYYRLSIAADWAARPTLARDAADQAFRYATGLPEHERLLLSALQALRAGRVDQAEALYRRVTEEYPGDPEAWFGLAEVLFHYGPLRGQSVTAARPAYERVLRLEPADAESLIHLARIAALEERTADADSLVRRARKVVPDAEAMEIRAVRAFALGDGPGFKYVTRQLLSHPRQVPGATAIQVAVYPDDLDGAERFGRTLMDPAEARITRGFAHRLVARTALARGQLQRAERELATAAAVDATPTLELRALAVAFPLFSFPRSTVAEVLQAVEDWQVTEIPADSLHSAAHAGLHAHIRLHRLGILRLALGDIAGAGEAVAALERLPGDERLLPYARALAWSLRARAAAAAGRPEDALAMLDRAEWPLAADVFAAEVADRFLRAELLEQVGRPTDALRWHESIAQRAMDELVYLAPSLLRQATIYDRLGNRTEALRRYRRFIELWRECDPELRPVVRGAERRITELERRS